ncbi:dienelactone hydrolase family protein [Flexivirga meconopsidis]|uniref:dienelactone hydrolase family protein n=1 Tax=Flexivirga meconopsidis TaxID=2977121 RepID=UPI00223F7ABF|nr:dienelactone hydrolase family protein [Flexivirga meconopsidis]
MLQVTVIEIPMTDGTAEAYLTGVADHPQPGVLLFMDAIGLRPRIEEMADRIAAWGYTVLAPNAFYRNGKAVDLAPDGPLDTDAKREEFFGGAMQRVHGLTADLAERDIPQYLDALLSQPKVTAPVGVVGYCMGARLAIRASYLRPEQVAAAAGFHGGGLATDEPDSPHARLSEARADFVFGHADGDRSMDATAIERLGAALRDAGLQASNEVYAGASHGYTMADSSVYDEAATERSFAEMRELFDRKLKR